jgi:glucokinase
MAAAIPVLEIGGTHVTAAAVDPSDWRVESSTRYSLDADASADALIQRFFRAGNALRARAGATWGIAMPDPFDYARGIGLFEGVGKFTALRGVDVGDALRSRLRGRPAFLNDADAFLLGEWAAGAAVGAGRCVGITLGTGIGSAWLVDGQVVDPGVPPGGRIHRLSIGGEPLEDVVSRRAMRRAFAAAGGDPAADVREIADQARAGSRLARGVLDAAMTALGRVVGRCTAGFRADLLVIGGSMSASWDLFEPAFRAGALGNGLPRIEIAADSERAPLIGAALHAVRSGRAFPRN